MEKDVEKKIKCKECDRAISKNATTNPLCEKCWLEKQGVSLKIRKIRILK